MHVAIFTRFLYQMEKNISGKADPVFDNFFCIWFLCFYGLLCSVLLFVPSKALFNLAFIHRHIPAYQTQERLGFGVSLEDTLTWSAGAANPIRWPVLSAQYWYGEIVSVNKEALAESLRTRVWDPTDCVNHLSTFHSAIYSVYLSTAHCSSTHQSPALTPLPSLFPHVFLWMSPSVSPAEQRCWELGS